MNLPTPFNGLLLVRRQESEVETQQGLHIPEAAREKLNYGMVLKLPVNCNCQCSTSECLFSEGDQIMWGRGCETAIEVEGETLLLIHVDDVLVRID